MEQAEIDRIRRVLRQRPRPPWRVLWRGRPLPPQASGRSVSVARVGRMSTTTGGPGKLGDGSAAAVGAPASAAAGTAAAAVGAAAHTTATAAARTTRGRAGRPMA
jgi:hypothetical protein